MGSHGGPRVAGLQYFCNAAVVRAAITITRRGVITLPARLRKALGLRADDQLIAEVTPEGLLLRPAVTLPVEIYTPEREKEFDDPRPSWRRRSAPPLVRDAPRPPASVRPAAVAEPKRRARLPGRQHPVLAAKTAGAVRELLSRLEAGGHVLCADAYVVGEARRNLLAKGPEAMATFEAMLPGVEVSAFHPGALPARVAALIHEKDRPVVAAAVRLRCDALLTGDRTHFGALYGERVLGVAVHSPRSLAESLRL